MTSYAGVTHFVAAGTKLSVGFREPIGLDLNCAGCPLLTLNGVEGAQTSALL
jgi:hypothetical protein